MKTLRKTAEEAYLKYANKIINRETWIDGFISGIQYKKRISTIYRALRPAVGHREFGHRRLREGRPSLLHMAGGNGCREGRREALAELSGMESIVRSRLDLGRRVKGPLVRG